MLVLVTHILFHGGGRPARSPNGGLYNMAEKTQKKRWGDRRDAVWRRDLPSMNNIMTHIMPNRADNEAFISLKIDLRPLDAYLAKLNEGRTEDKYTYFHIISAAIGKAFVLRPRMNFFIANNKIYERRRISVAFVVKKKFEDKSEEGLAFLYYDKDTTLQSFHENIMKVIHATRRTDKKDTSSDAMDVLMKLPHPILKLLMKVLVWADKHGWLPDSLIGSDPCHAAIMLSNLGSIGLECGYHHLSNWGTNSCFIVVGKKHMIKTVNEDGTEDPHMIIPLGITLDERIADGYYYSRTVKLVKHLLANPQLLEAPADTPVEYD